MVKLVYCIRRASGLSRESFQHYWLEQHAPLVKSLAKNLGACRYVQSHTVDSEVAAQANHERGSLSPLYDGITEFWWYKLEDMLPSGISSEEIILTQKLLLDDERKFIDVEQSMIFITQEYEIYNLI